MSESLPTQAVTAEEAKTMQDTPELPPYIYGQEAGPNEKVWTEAAIREVASRATRLAAAPQVVRDAAKRLREAHDASTPGRWRRGLTSHHTVTDLPTADSYAIGEFHHAADAGFCDVAHEVAPILCAAMLDAAPAASSPEVAPWPAGAVFTDLEGGFYDEKGEPLASAPAGAGEGASAKRIAELEETLEHTRYWYGTRHARLFDWAHSSLTDQQKSEYFSIVANGTASPMDPPTYAQQYNILKHENERLRTALAAADEGREDTKRLDWLDEKNKRFRMGWRVGTAPAGNVTVQAVIQIGDGPLTTIREAIDAAKEANNG